MKRETGLARVWSRGWGQAAVVAVVLAVGAGGATAVPSAAVAGSPPVLNWTSHSVAPYPGNQTFEAMAYDAATGTVVLFAFSGATWTWNGTAWTQLHLRVHPPAGSGQVMAYDAATGTVVLFGGLYHGKLPGLRDTWTWNGTVWTHQHPATSPPGQQFESMAYDAATGTVVLFSGCCNGSGGFLHGTWTWDGTTWTRQHPATSPSARWATQMAYDAATGTVVLFGGCCNRIGGGFGDTWTWDGTTWTRQHPATSPPQRENAVMAYDAATGTVVMFGGYDGSSLDGTWTWDGTTWARQFPATVPPARYGSQMAYDAATGTVVMFGGKGNTTMFDDTWTWG